MIAQTRLAKVFVELADTTHNDFDVTDHLATLTQRSAELVDADADAAGVLASDGGGALLAAHTSDQARDVELAEMRISQGPGMDCLGTGRQIVNVTPNQADAQWPLFSTVLSASGFRSVHAVPLRRQGRVLGAMTLLCRDRTALSIDDLAVGQALADVAAIGLLQHQELLQRDVLARQLQSALDSSRQDRRTPSMRAPCMLPLVQNQKRERQRTRMCLPSSTTSPRRNALVLEEEATGGTTRPAWDGSTTTTSGVRGAS